MSVASHQRYVGRAREASAVSPELVLVDPRLALLARSQLAEPDDTLDRVRRARVTSRTPPLIGASASERAIPSIALARPSGGARRARRSRLPGRWTPIVGRLAVLAAGACVLLGSLVVMDRTIGSRGDGDGVGASVPAGRTRADVDTAPSEPPVQQASSGESQAPPPLGRGEGSAGAVRRLAWASVADASAYHVELFRGSSLVFRADTTEPEIVIPSKWSVDGRPESLAPGEYGWYVWAVVAGRRRSEAIVRTKLRISPG